MEKWQNADTLLVWVSIIIGVMIVLVGTLIGVFYLSYRKMIQAKSEELRMKMEHQRSLMKVSLETQETERMRIAADLHDNIISKLTVIRLKTVTNTERSELDRLLGRIIDDSRRISHALLPPLYEEKPLKDILINTLKSWKNFYEIQHTADVRTEKDFDKAAKLQIARILQELLNNIHKHARATKICLMLRITSRYVTMIVKDNGIGFNGISKSGIGLQNIGLRAENLNAQYKFKSTKGKGTRFVFFMNWVEEDN